MMYTLQNTRIAMQDVVAVQEESPGARMVWLVIHLRGLPAPVKVHAYYDDVPPFYREWERARMSTPTQSEPLLLEVSTPSSQEPTP